MIIVICLGNYGLEYVHNWHNAAWIVADAVVPKDAWEFNKYAYADIAEMGNSIWVKPHTMMNNSGEVINHLDRKYQIGGNNLVVIYDDLDLPFGQVKIAHNRGAGGHNGIKSIVRHFGSQAFTRIRIGIAPADGRSSIPGDFRDYVLRNMTKNNYDDLRAKADTINQAIKTIAIEGYEVAMNEWNEKL